MIYTHEVELMCSGRPGRPSWRGADPRRGPLGKVQRDQ